VLPIAFGLNIDFLAREITYGAPSTQWWIQLSTAIVYGLSFATVLTLIVTPASLSGLSKLRARWDWLRRRWANWRGREDEPIGVEAPAE